MTENEMTTTKPQPAELMEEFKMATWFTIGNFCCPDCGLMFAVDENMEACDIMECPKCDTAYELAARLTPERKWCFNKLTLERQSMPHVSLERRSADELIQRALNANMMLMERVRCLNDRVDALEQQTPTAEKITEELIGHNPMKEFDIVGYTIKYPFTSARYFTRDKKTASIFCWELIGGLIVYDSCAPRDMRWIACSCTRYEHIDQDAAIKSIETGVVTIPPWRNK